MCPFIVKAVQVNQALHEIVFKLVYYGPSQSGKKTNLTEVHKLLDPAACSRLTTIKTRDDEALSFDLRPTTTHSASGFRIKLKLCTVPGKVVHATTRRIILAGADAVIFVANSVASALPDNQSAWQDLQRNLHDSSAATALPILVQFNQRDRDQIVALPELQASLTPEPEHVLGASAVRGEGVLESLHDACARMLRGADGAVNMGGRFDLAPEVFLHEVFAHALPQYFGAP